MGCQTVFLTGAASQAVFFRDLVRIVPGMVDCLKTYLAT